MRWLRRWRGTGIAVACVGTLALATGCPKSEPSDSKPSPAAEAVELFNGKNLDGWFAQEGHGLENTWMPAAAIAVDPADATKFVITDGEGVLVNGPTGRTCNLYCEYEHGDCEVHIEFMMAKGSNSGVYFLGCYELQILDSYGKDEVGYSDCGGIYARWIDEKEADGHAPRVNASKAPGEWQTFDVTFRAPRFDEDGKKIANARFVKVLLNDALVQDDVELNGQTRAPLLPEEGPRGPLMLQGDHGPVAFRNIRVTPLE